MPLYKRIISAHTYAGGANWSPSFRQILNGSDLPSDEYRWTILGMTIATQWPADVEFDSVAFPSFSPRFEASVPGYDGDGGETRIWPIQRRPWMVFGAGADVWMFPRPQPTGAPLSSNRLSVWLLAYAMHPQEWEVAEGGGT